MARKNRPRDALNDAARDALNDAARDALNDAARDAARSPLTLRDDNDSLLFPGTPEGPFALPVMTNTAIFEASLGQSASSQHAALMRARRNRPELVEAIIAVRGHNNPDPHPHKIAGTILPKVNTWLKERRYKPALVDAVARKIPHT
jgi:hypothetical protein